MHSKNYDIMVKVMLCTVFKFGSVKLGFGTFLTYMFTIKYNALSTYTTTEQNSYGMAIPNLVHERAETTHSHIMPPPLQTSLC